MLKRTIAIAFVTLLLLAALPVHATNDGCNCGLTPVIIVPGYTGSFLFIEPGEDSPEQLWPPIINGTSIRSIADVLLGTLPQLMLDAQGNAEHVVAQFGELMGMFELLELDEAGRPSYPTGVMQGQARDFRWDVMQERGQAHLSNQRPITNSLDIPHCHIYKFYNDWRLSHVYGAASLHAFIEEVIEDSGHSQVSLYAISHGGQLAVTYFHLYGSDLIDRAVLLAPAIRGSNLAIDFFESDHFAFEAARLLEVAMVYIGLETFFAPLFDRVSVDQLGDIALQIFRTYLKPLAIHFGSFWDLVPPEHYERFKAQFLDPVQHAQLIANANVVQHQVVPYAGEILRQAQENNTRIAILAGSGLPLVSGNAIDSDFIIDTASTTGARVSDIPLPYDHIFMSPNGRINASDAFLPYHTWFFCGQYHGQASWDIYANELYNLFLFSDQIHTVFSSPQFPQFRFSSNAIDGLGARFSGTVSGFFTADSELLFIRNLSNYEVTLLSVTAIGHDFTVPLHNRITMRPGETKRLRFESVLPHERLQFTLQLEFVRELAVPSRETRELVFTAIPAEDDLPAALRFFDDDMPVVPLRFYPVRAVLILLSLAASLALASVGISVIYRKQVGKEMKK